MVVAEAGGESGVGRPHFAAALVAVGAAESIDDAFERYPGQRPARPTCARRGCPGAEVARLARDSGGVAVLAHPYSLGLDGPDLARVVGELAEPASGASRPSTVGYSPRQRQRARATWPAASTWWPPAAPTTTA